MENPPSPENSSITQALEGSLNNDAAVSIASDIGETLIDQVWSEGILKDLPILGVFFNSVKVFTSVRDWIYVKKVLAFISATGGVSEKQKRKFFAELSKHKDKKDRLFDKILLTMERLDEVEKAKYIGKAFMHLVKGDIELSDYHRICSAIERVFLEDLEYFLLSNSNKPLDEAQSNKLHNLRLSIPKDIVDNDLIQAGIKMQDFKMAPMGNDLRTGSARLLRELKISRVGNLLLEIEYEIGLYFKK